MTAKPVNVKAVNVYLEHAQHELLKKLSEKTGAPVSELIRRAVDQYLVGMYRKKAADSKR